MEIRAGVQPIDIGMMTAVKDAVIQRFDGTAFHVTSVEWKVAESRTEEYMITGWKNGNSKYQQRIVVHAKNAGEAYESATAIFDKEPCVIKIIKVELQS